MAVQFGGKLRVLITKKETRRNLFLNPCLSSPAFAFTMPDSHSPCQVSENRRPPRTLIAFESLLDKNIRHTHTASLFRYIDIRSHHDTMKKIRFFFVTFILSAAASALAGTTSEGPSPTPAPDENSHDLFSFESTYT